MARKDLRQRALDTKDGIKQAKAAATAALKTVDDSQARTLLRRVIDDLTIAATCIVIPLKPRAPKKEPYRGGGTWHPPGMMPGGRYW